MNKPFYLIISLSFALTSQAQQTNYTKTPALGIHIAFFDFTGADSLHSFGKNMKIGLAINFQNSLSKQIDYNINLAGTFLDFTNRKNTSLGEGKKQMLLEADASVRTKLLPPKSLINPFAQLGTGFSIYKNYFGIYIPAGIGCQVNCTPDLFLLINSQYRIPVTNTQHRHFYHSIGLAGTINKKKINKTKPAPPPPPLSVMIKQPVDSDGDGIVDSVDQCPAIIGVIRYHGCPIPDRDGDGISDDEDRCPDVKGIRQYQGCPPPDKDGDGIEDALDKCPDIAGNTFNNGCPEIKTAVQEQINLAAKQIFFATNRYELLPKSFAALNEVVKVLQENPALQLHIEGHTDNTSTPEKNQVLSENRAGSVLQYLQKAGIPATRLHATGYGQNRPVAENTTAKGRAANRRVVLRITY